MQRTVAAPAKVNFILDVLGRRPNGYHDVAMLMVRLSLHDRVTVALVGGDAVTASCPGLELAAGEENIAARAARLFLEHTGLRRGVEISIVKRIPAAAGMGGGSSNAAAVLLALDDLLETGLSRSELQSLGVRLGADVPFFLCGEMAAWATGIGEVLEPWRGLPPCWLVLVNPRFAVSTAWVYQNLGLTHYRGLSKIPRFPERMEDVAGLLRNDLETVTSSRYPVIAEIKSRLIAAGAVGALMSGSGPTVFGVYADRPAAEAAAGELATDTGWWTAAVSPA
ncbi:MAG: 4-(cytidine 5'-diphospho)-2-C-methyl-D-erythritol kinase [Deltaproteobacteria bacterium]|nr:MAG: 4-(cytidine 5'-diphospho)-2-C-methyl-D-erythritol kinase [Deltaproteobacteria bacterium]